MYNIALRMDRRIAQIRMLARLECVSIAQHISVSIVYSALIVYVRNEMIFVFNVSIIELIQAVGFYSRLP